MCSKKKGTPGPCERTNSKMDMLRGWNIDISNEILIFLACHTRKPLETREHYYFSNLKTKRVEERSKGGRCGRRIISNILS